MQELIEYLTRKLVDDPDSVRVESVEEIGFTVYQIQVAQPDIGKVIGRQGRIATALRAVVKAAGLKNRKRATIEIIS